MKVPTVVNMKQSKCTMRIDRASKWGNPFKLGSEINREKCIEEYRHYFLLRPDLIKALPELSGHTLGCWCKPLACHGDVLVEMFCKYVMKENPVMKFAPGNIWSGNRQLAVFTNPTELAFRKGNLKHHYPITIDGQVFEDCEAAYHFLTKNYKDNFEACQLACIRVVAAKLRQYPLIFNTIKECGGLPWIEQCCHFTGARTKAFQRYEGQGYQSAFIHSLALAYTAVTIEKELCNER